MQLQTDTSQVSVEIVQDLDPAVSVYWHTVTGPGTVDSKETIPSHELVRDRAIKHVLNVDNRSWRWSVGGDELSPVSTTRVDGPS